MLGNTPRPNANLLIGGVIEALWAIIDFIIRDKVLRNRHLFDQ